MGISVLHPTDEEDIDENLELDVECVAAPTTSPLLLRHKTNRLYVNSIIAIHGLNGNSMRTWTEPKSKKLWLRDFLPSDLKRARIMTFGYDATPVLSNSLADIEDHANNLLGCLRERREDVSCFSLLFCFFRFPISSCCMYFVTSA